MVMFGSPGGGAEKLSRSCSCRFARFRQAIHIQVAARAPLRAGHVSQSRRGQHQRRLSIGKRSHRSRSSPDFPQQSFQRIIRSQATPVLANF
jgi:hypothetical protein